MTRFNPELSKFLDEQNHPLRPEIELLRQIILNSVEGLEENIKWNGPNYSHNGEDRVTMRINPPKQLQLIFHRGAKKLVQPEGRLIDDGTGLLVWKENDRAVVTFKSVDEIKKGKEALTGIVQKWVEATMA